MFDIPLLIFAHAIAFLKSKSLTTIVNNTIAIHVSFCPAETLAAVGNPVQIEIISDVNFHGF